MANNQRNVQPQVVTTTTTVSNRRGRRRRRRANRVPQSTTTTVRRTKVTKPSVRPRRRRNNRPGNPNQSAPPILRQRVTATLGTVGSNQGDAIELEMAALLNPALIKETTGSNQYAPLQMWAANYNMWRANNIYIKFIPLVGSSAVSGTAVRCSLNLAATPGSPSWSALGARRHKDTSPGKPMVMKIPGHALAGPKDGWFLCSTKHDPQMCIGASIEIHTLGKTMSCYQAQAFDGPLFLVEMTAEWMFKNFNPEPGMMNLVKTDIQEKPNTVKINATPGEPITISVPKDSQLARATGLAGVEADATPSEIIWSIFDTTMDAVTGFLPPPFEWLFRAGWWFVKRVANKNVAVGHTPGIADAGEITFQVFQSLSDAKNDVPCLATGTAHSENIKPTGWHLTQVTPGNVGAPQATLMNTRMYNPTTDPIEISSTPALGRPAFFGHIHNETPQVCIAGQQAVGGESKVYTYVAWELENPVFTQNGQVVDPTQLQALSYPIFAKQSTTSFQPIGRVYAANYTKIGRGTPYLHWTTVLWKAEKTITITMQGTSRTTDRFVFLQPTQSPQAGNFPTTIYKAMLTDAYSFQGGHARPVTITQGKWYLSPFVAFQVQTSKDPEFTNYGVPFYRSTAFPNSQDISYDLLKEAFDAGAVMQTTRPLILKPPVSTANTLTALEVAQLRQLLAPKDYQPSEYDNLEMPPLEEEEEEEQGAAGGSELQRDIKNWVEFGHRKRPPTPFSPIEEGEEEEEESDLDDDDYAEVPSYIKNLLIPEAKKLLDDLKKMGLSHEKAVRAAQSAYPHPAVEVWEEAYHNALVDGLSPPSARDCAWGAVSDYLP
nr:MAG: capsid protein precursor [Mamastrovirus 3]